MKGRLIILSLFLGLLVNIAVIGGVSASTVNVTSTMSNSQIQSVLNNAKSGDTVNFLGRFYQGIQLIITKTLHLVSSVGTVLSGTNSPGSIVLLVNGSKASGTTINGFNITNSETGVVINNTNWTALSNNCIKSVTGSAVTVNRSSNTNLVNNNISNSDTGITVERSNNTKITSSQMKSNKYGVFVNNSENTAINHDNVTNSAKHGIRIYNSVNTSINDTTVKNSKSNAIEIYNSNRTVINSSKMTGNGKSLDPGYVDPDSGSSKEQNGNGVYIQKSDKVKVLNCNISENFRGISANSVSNLTVGNNLLLDNNFEGILLLGNINTGLIKSNLIQANNNGIKVNCHSTNLNIIGNVMTYNQQKCAGCENGHGLRFGTSFQDNGTIVEHNIITKNTYAYSQKIPGLGSNFYGDSDFEDSMKLVLIRTGENNYTAYFEDGKTGKIVTELPSLWFKITTSDGNSFWVQMKEGTVDITPNNSDGDITVTLDTSVTLPYYFSPHLISDLSRIDAVSISSNSAVTSKPDYDSYLYQDWDASGMDDWTNEEPPINNNSNSNDNPNNNDPNSGNTENNPSNPGNEPNGTNGNTNTAKGVNLPGGLAAVTAALTGADSSTGQAGSNGGGTSQAKTAQELLIDNVNKNPQGWAIAGIVILLILIFGAYYRTDLMNMIRKAKK